MAGAAILCKNEELLRFLDELHEKYGDLTRLLSRWGDYQVGRVKRRFQEKGPGWPPKNPYFAELQRRSGSGGNTPLTFRKALSYSIVYDVSGGNTLRVGSNLSYAAMQQFGSRPGRPHIFNLFIVPDKNPDGTFQRDENGRLLGRIALSQDASAHKQLMRINITARPYLVEPNAGEERDMIYIAEQHLLEQSGKGGKA